jgi:hypothetical protein
VSHGSIFEPQPRSTEEDRVAYGNNCDATQSHSTNSSTDSVLRLYLPKIEETMKPVSVRLFLPPFRGLVDRLKWDHDLLHIILAVRPSAVVQTVEAVAMQHDDSALIEGRDREQWRSQRRRVPEADQ